MRTLYLCYFGLREPLVQTQVLPYLKELAKDPIQVTLLTFEPDWPVSWLTSEHEEWQHRLKDSGIVWRVLKYHRRPSLPGTLWDILCGVVEILRLRPDVLHARGHIPLAMALVGSRLTSSRVIFDIRGLLADEYVDAGIMRFGGPSYRALKWLERAGIRNADQIVVLTEKMRDWVLEQGWRDESAIEVIPCCVNLAKFKEEPIESRDLVYAGSVTGLYQLEEMGRFCLSWKKIYPTAKLRILTGAPATEVLLRLSGLGVTEGDVWIGRVDPCDVPAHLSQAGVGLSFRKATFSQIAASPTKIPEYLAAGLPVVANRGAGDTDKILENHKVGVIIDDLSGSGIDLAAGQLSELMNDTDLARRCKQVAREYFDLETVGGIGYRKVYQQIIHKTPISPKI